ncbi:MAG: hypothetical protein JSR65_10590 [Proteobacteria bacterium]|nr:hypothetical protein [Pseudomonadota bacterium]
MRPLLLCLFLSLLGGCNETRFESPIGMQSNPCDPRWKGLWVGPDPDDRDTALYVDSDCRLSVLDVATEEKSARRVELRVEFAHVDDRDYLIVDDASLRDLFTFKPPFAIDPPPPHTYSYVRYRIDGDTLNFDLVDSERVAQLVIDGTLQGTVSKTSGELHVFVQGDAGKMLDTIRTQPVFGEGARAHSTRLVRSSLTLREFERQLQRKVARKSP